MTRIISCNVIDSASLDRGDVQRASVSSGLTGPVVPTVEYYAGLPGGRGGCGSGFGPASYNTTGVIRPGLIIDILA